MTFPVVFPVAGNSELDHVAAETPPSFGVFWTQEGPGFGARTTVLRRKVGQGSRVAWRCCQSNESLSPVGAAMAGDSAT